MNGEGGPPAEETGEGFPLLEYPLLPPLGDFVLPLDGLAADTGDGLPLALAAEGLPNPDLNAPDPWPFCISKGTAPPLDGGFAEATGSQAAA